MKARLQKTMFSKTMAKRAAAVSLAVFTVFSMTACGKSGGNVDTTGGSIDENVEITFPLAETQTLTFITNASSTSTQEPNERTIFKRLEEATNVHIDWTCYVSNEFWDKRNLALANAATLPDGLFNAGMGDYDLIRYAKQGVIIPLETYIDAYMPNLSGIFEKCPEYRAMATSTDGHIYAFPWIEQLGEGKTAIQTIGDIPYINTKWLKALGLEMPKTIDDLTNVLREFKEKDPAGGGKTIPMSFIANDGDQDPGILFAAFGEGYGDTGAHLAVTNDKKVICQATQDGYKQAIVWMHQLQEEGLLDPEAYTHEWSTYVSKGKEGRYGVCFTWDVANVGNLDDYEPLPALEGPDGMVSVTRQVGSATSGFDRGRCVLTSKCSNIPLACAWIDLMYVPAQSVQNNWGTYGEDGFNIFNYDETTGFLSHAPLGDASPVEVREAQCVGGPLCILNEYYGEVVTCPDDAQYRLDWIADIYAKDIRQEYAYPNVFMDADDIERCDQLWADINSYINTCKSNWMMNGGVEQEWDSYLQKLEDYGLSEYLEIKQKYLDAYFESIGE